MLLAIRTLQQTDDFATRVDDVVGLRSDALLVRWTSSGTVHTSGAFRAEHPHALGRPEPTAS